MKSLPKHNIRLKDGKKVNIKSKNHFLIYHALTNASECYWPKEIRLAKKLLESFPDLEFWRDCSVEIFDNKPRSLSAYLTANNLRLVSNKYHNYEKLKNLDFSSRKCYTLEEKKIGEDKIYPQKDKNVLDFLRNGEEKNKEK